MDILAIDEAIRRRRHQIRSRHLWLDRTRHGRATGPLTDHADCPSLNGNSSGSVNTIGNNPAYGPIAIVGVKHRVDSDCRRTR